MWSRDLGNPESIRNSILGLLMGSWWWVPVKWFWHLQPWNRLTDGLFAGIRKYCARLVKRKCTKTIKPAWFHKNYSWPTMQTRIQTEPQKCPCKTWDAMLFNSIMWSPSGFVLFVLLATAGLRSAGGRSGRPRSQGPTVSWAKLLGSNTAWSAYDTMISKTRS